MTISKSYTDRCLSHFMYERFKCEFIRKCDKVEAIKSFSIVTYVIIVYFEIDQFYDSFVSSFRTYVHILTN